MKKPFSNWALLKEGFTIFSKNWERLVLMLLITILISLGFQVIFYVIEYPYFLHASSGKVVGQMPLYCNLLVAFFSVLNYLLSIWIAYNCQKIYLKIVDGGRFEVIDLFKKIDLNSFKWFIVNLLYSLYFVIPAGVTFFAIFSVYMSGASFGILTLALLLSLCLVGFSLQLAVKYVFASTLVLDKGVKIVEAFSISANMTKNNKLNIFKFYLLGLVLLVLSVLVGLICFVVGVIPTLLIFSLTFSLASALLYRKFAL